MKKLFLLTILLSGLFLTSCTKENTVKLSTVTVKIAVSSNYESEVESLEGIEVILKNTTDNVESKALTNTTGEVLFSQVPSGNYNISASKKLSVSLTLNNSIVDKFIAPGIDEQVTLTLDGQPSKDDFVIKELFTCGSRDYAVMFKAQFMELYNNTDKVLYADGLYFAELAGATGSDENDKVLGLEVGDYVYAQRVAKIPGSGKEYPVQPGKSIVIAFNAINFKDAYKEGNSFGLTLEDYIDLSGADFEINAESFLSEKGFTGNAYFDIDNPSVKNVDIIYMNNAGDNTMWIFNSYGSGMIIFRSETALNLNDLHADPENSATDPIKYLRLNSDIIIDGVDVLDNTSAAKFKRLPKLVDAGFTYLKADGGASYSGMSVRRKVEKEESGRKILMDTNNSSNDFEAINIPTPRNY